MMIDSINDLRWIIATFSCLTSRSFTLIENSIDLRDSTVSKFLHAPIAQNKQILWKIPNKIHAWPARHHHQHNIFVLNLKQPKKESKTEMCWKLETNFALNARSHPQVSTRRSTSLAMVIGRVCLLASSPCGDALPRVRAGEGEEKSTRENNIAIERECCDRNRISHREF